MNYKNQKIAVGIPAYNEQDTIGPVLEKTSTYVPFIIVGDDGSDDLTSDIAKQHGTILVKHDSNEGYGAILKSIFEKAKQIDVDILVTMDGDGQHNPEDLENIIAPILNGEADITIASRYLTRTSRKEIPYFRSIAIQIVTWIINKTSNLLITDSQSGYRAYSKKAITVLDISDKKMGASLEILYKADENNLSVTEVPTLIKYSRSTKKYNLFSQGVELFTSILKHIPSSPSGKTLSNGFNPYLSTFLICLSRLYSTK
jgi:glycosyltransferase involved in cell wall biosynthesis